MATQTKIQIPRPDENSDFVRISGTKDGIDKARHEIECISEEQVRALSFGFTVHNSNTVSIPRNNCMFQRNKYSFLCNQSLKFKENIYIPFILKT